MSQVIFFYWSFCFISFSSNSNISLHSASQNYLKCLKGSTKSLNSKICINSSQAWNFFMQLWQSKEHIHFKMSFRVVSLIGSRKRIILRILWFTIEVRHYSYIILFFFQPLDGYYNIGVISFFFTSIHFLLFII